MIRLADIPIEIDAEEPLSSEELDYLARVGSRDGGGEVSTVSSEAGAFRLTVRSAPPAGLAELIASRPHDEPAAVEWDSSLVRVAHPTFAAELDPFGRQGVLWRLVAGPGPLEVTLKVAVACLLPLEGGLPLHAAGLVIDGRSHVFFGVSGAGKSTLAELSPFPVLSDELVAITGPEPFAARATGFWGTLDYGDAPRGAYPLAALYELRKGTRFTLESVGEQDSRRRLLAVTMVPPAPPLWSIALGVIGCVCARVPVYRMTWTPDEPPWDRLPR